MAFLSAMIIGYLVWKLYMVWKYERHRVEDNKNDDWI